MEKAHIRIYIQPEDYNVRFAQEFCIDLDSPLIGDIMFPIDCSDPGMGMMPSNLVEQRHTVLLGTRESIAKRLSQLFTEKIMESFSAKDTINGYSQKEMREMDGPKQYITPAQLYSLCHVSPIIPEGAVFNEYNRLEDKHWWDVAANTLNESIEKKEKR